MEPHRLARPDPIIRVDGIAYVVFEKPDLDRTARFCADFGLAPVSRTADALYLRAAGPAPFVYVARRAAAARFVGAGFRAARREDLDVLAAQPGASPVTRVDEPGGGERVTLTDLDGLRVDVVYGAAPVEPLPIRTAALPLNTPFTKPRMNAGQRPALHPAEVVRLGHLVLETTDFAGRAAWYMRHLGLIPTDVQCLRDGTPMLAFMRCDRGAAPADHHTVVVAGGARARYVHSAWEVLDLDEVGMGQQWLKAGGWRHAWGIGRHLLGSQIFDYWRDPEGFEIEHYADGDVFDAGHPTGYHPFDPKLLWIWGQDLPADFLPRPTPANLLGLAAQVVTGKLSLGHLRQLAAAAVAPARPWLGGARKDG
jgi:Glyoxalase/Bleomycin resistance protein/Dioxygenase superfamily